MMDRFQQVKINLFPSSSNQNKESATPDERTLVRLKTKQRWWQRGRADDQVGSKAKQDASPTRTKQGGSTLPASTKKQKKAVPETAATTEEVANEEKDPSQESIPASSKRRWFGLRRTRASDGEARTQTGVDTSAVAGQTTEHSGSADKRTRSSSSSKTKATASTPTQRTDAADTEADSADEKAPRKGLMGWRRKKANQQQDETKSESPKPQSQQAPTASKPTPPKPQHDAGDQLGEEDDIDWNSMSKAQRRRLRKQMKRQNKAA